jgi:hypothetical protein
MHALAAASAAQLEAADVQLGAGLDVAEVGDGGRSPSIAW